MGDEKLIIINVAVRGINDHIRFYSQMLCAAAINTSNTTRTQTFNRLCMNSGALLHALAAAS